MPKDSCRHFVSRNRDDFSSNNDVAAEELDALILYRNGNLTRMPA
jgi:hypothetical protein